MRALVSSRFRELLELPLDDAALLQQWASIRGNNAAEGGPGTGNDLHSSTTSASQSDGATEMINLNLTPFSAPSVSAALAGATSDLASTGTGFGANNSTGTTTSSAQFAATAAALRHGSDLTVPAWLAAVPLGGPAPVMVPLPVTATPAASSSDGAESGPALQPAQYPRSAADQLAAWLNPKRSSTWSFSGAIAASLREHFSHGAPNRSARLGAPLCVRIQRRQRQVLGSL